MLTLVGRDEEGMAGELNEKIQLALREVLDQPLATAREELAARLSWELEVAENNAAQAARAAAIQALSVAVRRIRQAGSVTEIGEGLLETASAYCGRTAVMARKGDSINGWRGAGFASSNGSFVEAWARFHVPLHDAPALAQVVETKDAVVSLALPQHLSAGLVELFGSGPEEKVYLFPLAFRDKIVAVLYADTAGSGGVVNVAALELLCSVAEACIEAIASRAADPGARDAGQPRLELDLPRAVPANWETLSPGERDLHLRAQRFARVLVADLQLYRSQQIREGREMRNLYGRLKDEIDKSREVYQRKFGHSAGVDYFHAELITALAGGQESLLGPDYPGPLVS